MNKPVLSPSTISPPRIIKKEQNVWKYLLETLADSIFSTCAHYHRFFVHQREPPELTRRSYGFCWRCMRPPCTSCIGWCVLCLGERPITWSFFWRCGMLRCLANQTVWLQYKCQFFVCLLRIYITVSKLKWNWTKKKHNIKRFGMWIKTIRFFFSNTQHASHFLNSVTDMNF